MTKYLDKLASLTPRSVQVICDKGTESPNSGIYNTLTTNGTYLCRRCGFALFRADSQFSSGCGWPSFDVCIPDSVQFQQDIDGLRTEITCKRCGGHLGHVFDGEFLTVKNRRFCVNAASLDFVESNTILDSQEAIVAGGCFWGVEFYMRSIPGVVKVEAGYIGGMLPDPTYSQVCEGGSGHYEAVRVLFDSKLVNYSTILRRFFEIHDPTQTNGQGPDLGQQYCSAVFYYNDDQRFQVECMIQQLRDNGYNVSTRLHPVSVFWAAETYHQNYYSIQNKHPYCHQPVLRFDTKSN